MIFTGGKLAWFISSPLLWRHADLVSFVSKCIRSRTLVEVSVVVGWVEVTWSNSFVSVSSACASDERLFLVQQVSASARVKLVVRYVFDLITFRRFSSSMCYSVGEVF